MDIAISIKGLKKKFGQKEVLRGIDLDIIRHKTTIILGLSGSGKSTIIKHIVGLLRPDSGEILVDGVDVANADEKTIFKIRKKVGFLFQSGALFDSMNVFENIAFPLREHTKLTQKEMIKKVEKSLEMVGLKPKEVMALYPDELSGGMRKRVGLARTIIMEPEIILFDEPTTGLDPITCDLISRMILHLQSELNVTSVLISHDIKESFKVGDYFAFLYQGKIIDFGDKDKFLNTDNEYVKQFLNGESEGPIKIVG
ncbi:ABC transporter ATP-binding protein [Nitrosophilus labii]|uniref:ABC transporter ATP-binding protein n=1 Tax=Nitrosophilus labii TaxID=2706014 RepID=UPI0016569F18|nr:ABC transporter ATP-binding protein [Nitrosophilus labii]